MNDKEIEIIKEVAEEEGMTFEEIKEIWEEFKNNIPTRKTNKFKVDKTKRKAKNKASKISRKKNRK